MKELYIFVALFISFLWGLAPVIHKLVLKNVNPITVFILSGVIYAFVMVFFMAWHTDTLKKDIPKIELRDLGLIAFASIIDAFLANLLYYNVLRDHESYIVSALIFSSPVFTLLLGYLFLQEKITLMGALGVFLIILGVICISANTYKIEEYVNYL